MDTEIKGQESQYIDYYNPLHKKGWWQGLKQWP